MSDVAAPALRLEGITKRFGGLAAVDDVTLEMRRGEVFAIVGENGAGKSTLMNMAYGLLRPDAGRVLVKGEPVELRSPLDAIEAGIGMVHQHFKLVRTLTVAENVALGDEPRAALAFDLRAAEETVRALAATLGFAIDPKALAGDLPVGAQQRVEILKSLSRGADILLLDEPTAVLTPQEADDLFRVIRALVAQGKTIVFVSHKLAEVMAVSSRVAVMRGGKLVTQLETAKTSARDIAREMVGRDPAPPPAGSRTATVPPGAPLLSLERVSAVDERALPALRELSLEVRPGEIVGIAGVEGNGQTELVEVIAGLRAASAGVVRVLGREGASAAALLDGGLAHIPGDRLQRAVIPEMSVRENVLLGRHREPRFGSAAALDRRAVAAEADRIAEALDVRPRDGEVPLGSLSGGNQQKVVVGRELGRPPKLLLAVHPTRGVDIGAIERIHAALLAERDRGVGILLVSADLAEILALSDRVLVMYGGRVVHEAAGGTTDERTLGPFMTGATA